MERGIRTATILQQLEASGQAFCKRHGLHSNWRNRLERSPFCVFCNKRRNKSYYDKHKNDPAFRERRKLADNRWGRANRFLRRFYDARSRAKKINLPFSITLEDLRAKLKAQGNRCALSGLPLTEQMASPDRINSDLGYTPENIQLVLMDLNYMKNDLPEPEFIRLCRAVVKKHGLN